MVYSTIKIIISHCAYLYKGIPTAAPHPPSFIAAKQSFSHFFLNKQKERNGKVLSYLKKKGQRHSSATATNFREQVLCTDLKIFCFVFFNLISAFYFPLMLNASTYMQHSKIHPFDNKCIQHTNWCSNTLTL